MSNTCVLALFFRHPFFYQKWLCSSFWLWTMMTNPHHFSFSLFLSFHILNHIDADIFRNRYKLICFERQRQLDRIYFLVLFTLGYDFLLIGSKRKFEFFEISVATGSFECDKNVDLSNGSQDHMLFFHFEMSSTQSRCFRCVFFFFNLKSNRSRKTNKTRHLFFVTHKTTTYFRLSLILTGTGFDKLHIPHLHKSITRTISNKNIKNKIYRYKNK